MIELARLNRLIDEKAEERLREFKLQFLPIYTMKSWFQELPRCGIESRTRWDQEKQDGRCLDSSIRLISNSNGLNIETTDRFIGFLGVTVRSKWSTVTMERSIMDRFKKVVAVSSRWTVQMRSNEMRYKTPWFAPLGSWLDGRDALLEIKSWLL